MWQTPSGERTLVQSEAELIRELVGYVYEQIDRICPETGIPFESDVGLFDRLQRPQQLALLHEVGTALLASSAPAPELTAMRESTAVVLFRALLTCLKVEIDFDESPGEDHRDWRRLLREVHLEQGEPEYDLPPTDSTDIDEWDFLVDATVQGILWDADWEMEELFVDEDPDQASGLKELMNIPEDYYRDVAPDPSRAELETIRHQLDELTGANR